MDEATGNTAAVASGTTLGIVLLVLAIVYRCTNWANRYHLSCVHSDGSFGCICREANVPNPLDEMAKAHAAVVKQLQDDLKNARDALIQQRVEESHRRREAEERAQRNLRALRRDFQRALSRHRAHHQGTGSDDSPPLSEHVPPGLLNTDSMQRLRMRVSLNSPGAAAPTGTPRFHPGRHALAITPVHRRRWSCLTPTTVNRTPLTPLRSDLRIDIDEPTIQEDITVLPLGRQVPVSSSAPLRSRSTVSVYDAELSHSTGSALDNGPGTTARVQDRNEGHDSNSHSAHCRYEV